MVCWRLLILRKMNPEGQAATTAKVAHAYAGRRSNNSNKLKNGRKWSVLVTLTVRNFSLIAEGKRMDSRLLKTACVVVASACVGFMPMGCKKAPPVTLACNASAPAIFPGEPVNLAATPGDLSTKKNVSVIYTWTGEGVTGDGSKASVKTASLAPGAYTVKVGVKEGKKGKEGLKPGQAAECSTGYTVKEFEPPTVSCSSAPSTIKPGESSTITVVALSPQNRPLTYSYSTAAGTVEGATTTATFSSTGAPAGPVGITCKVADDKGHTASGETTVTIVAPPPPPPPIPHAEALCSLTFDTDAKRPTRVDNEAKACLDEVALDLQKQADAKVVIVGESNTEEKTPPKHHHKNAKVVDFAAQRAVNAKDYLVTEKGIDASRISVTTSATEGQKVENYLVPADAVFSSDVQGTTPVDESAVKAQERKPLAERHHQ
jgi:hypothetical protein